MFDDPVMVREAVRAGFYKKSILVVGDLILDRYLWGDVNRISPESPVPVVLLTRENEVGGGAANVAINLARLGLDVHVAGFVGSDGRAKRLTYLMMAERINTDAVVTAENWSTISKTRVIGGHQQMLRIDREGPLPAHGGFADRLIKHVFAKIDAGLAAVILSDYAKGVLTADVCQQIIARARALQIPVYVDPKGTDFEKYSGATTVSPNRKELASVSGIDEFDVEGLMDVGEEMIRTLGLDFLTVTLSGQGIALVDQDGRQRIPAVAREIFDVSGAGDTVIALLAAALASGLSRLDALRLANIGAGVVVGRVGTSPVNKDDILKSINTKEALEQSGKICLLPELLVRADNWRARGERIIFTNGCFDLLHAGHVSYLEEAKHLGHHLVVGLNTDRSVRALKGESRPVIGQEDRARVLAALSAVDAVILFDEETPLELIKALRPDVLAKGADYREDQVVGGDLVKSWGGDIALVKLTDGKSTSRIMEAIQADRSK